MRQNRSKDRSQPNVENYGDVLEIVEQLAEILDRSDLSEVRIRDNEFEVQVSRYRGAPGVYEQPVVLQPGAAAGAHQQPAADTGSEGVADSSVIRAPMPSRFYRSPSPEEPPFVEVGDIVAQGDSVAVLEVMKTYNPVEAPFNCEILEILAEDGDAVEYSQPLFRVKQT